ncbi:MAG: hypothetical protein PHE56_01785 [Bacteroidales bacterium]|nr:hypothetical protein [Bacteroidales bacterium]
MKSFFKPILIIACIFGLSFITRAQNLPLSVKLKNDTILLGAQTELILEAKVPKSDLVLFPVYKDTISKNIELIKESETQITESGNDKIFKKSYIITSFDTGLNIIPSLPLRLVSNSDTNLFLSTEAQIYVKPYVLLDTIPVDTIYADFAGYVVYGKDGFKKEIEQYIPDSVKQSVPADSLDAMKKYVYEQLYNIFSSELTQNTGFYDKDDITKIAESSTQKMFLVDKSGILKDYVVAGSVDTVFVQEYQQVTQGQPLFTLYRIKDIKGNQYNTPFNLAELWYYFKKYLKQFWWAIILLLAILATLIYFLVFDKKGKKPTLFKIKPDEPAHVIALAKLEHIRKEKIWSRGQTKEFHVQITDVIREYLENRFGIQAIEMTSSEILEITSKTGEISNEDQIKLRQILEIADAVKFAKYQALQNENDLSLRNSFEFVENTKEIIDEKLNLKLSEPQIELNETIKQDTSKNEENE